LCQEKEYSNACGQQNWKPFLLQGQKSSLIWIRQVSLSMTKYQKRKLMSEKETTKG